MSIARKFAILVALVVGTITADPASAAPRFVIDLSGLGTTTAMTAGSASVSGSVDGRPFSGTFAGELYARDGSLPDPGVCEPAWARVTVTGALRGFLRLRATGEVCGEFLQPPTSLATHRFTGRYRVMSSTRPALVGTDGFLEIVLADDGRAGVLAIDT